MTSIIDHAPLLQALSADACEALCAAARVTHLAPGEALFPEGVGAGALYVIVDGTLQLEEPDGGSAFRIVRLLQRGDVLDGLQEHVGGVQLATVRATSACEVLVIPGEIIDVLVDRHADLRDARDRMHRRQLLTRLHRLFGPIGADLLDELEGDADWLHLHRGEVLWNPGDASDGLHVVISGRLALVHVHSDGTEEVQGEVRRGETIGEAGFFSGRPRAYRVRALRDAVLVGYSTAEFERIVARHPQAVRHITASVAARAASPALRRGAATVTVIALVRASPNARLDGMAERLATALARHGPVLTLDSPRVDALMTEPGIAQAADDSADEQRLLAWLDGCESRFRFILCVCDDAPGAWSRRAVRRADRVVLVGEASDPPAPMASERGLSGSTTGVADPRALLVLVHRDGSRAPSGTTGWLDARPMVDEHHHVRWDTEGDVARVARVLAGRAVGVVLGGGGARGFAHIGILRALAEGGVPVDMIGGTSMGASIAGQHAMGREPAQIAAMSRRVFLEVKPHRGFTLPILSLVNSRRTELAGRICYGDVAIEDLWLPFFCVSSNLTTAEVMVHRRGTLWRAALASTSLPGVGTPVLHDRQLLVDGAVLNNLPTDVMRRLGCGTILAAAVSSEDRETFTCDRVPTTWEMLRGRYASNGGRIRFPSILDVILRSSLLHSAYRERMSLLEADLVIAPPIQEFTLLDFARIDDIVAAGYVAATSEVLRWRESAAHVFA